MKFAQIVDGKVHYIFEADIPPNFASNIVLVDISEVTPSPLYGYIYDEEANIFIEPPIVPIMPIIPIPPSAEEIQMQILLNSEFMIIMSELNMG